MGITRLIFNIYKIMGKRIIMKLLKKCMVFAMAIVIGCCSCSCNKKKDDYLSLEDGECGITITDKKVIYQIQEKFDKDYYDEDDVEKQVEDEVKGFVDREGKGSAELSEFEIEDKKCHVVITFAGIEEFADYVNKCEKPIEEFHIYKGSYGEIDREIYGDSENLIDEKIATKAEFEEEPPVDSKITAVDSDSKVLVLNKALKIKTDDKISAVSMGVVVKDDVAKTNGEMCYIVYK